jgi:hypothetical protein
MKPYLVDVNVWIAHVYEGHELYPRAVRWFDTLEPEHAVCCRIAQIGLLRALTNASIMSVEVRSMQKAWDAYSEIAADPRFAFADEPRELESAFRSLSSLSLPAPKLWTDAYLAAFANAAGIALATFDGAFSTRGGVSDLVIIE